MSKWTFASAAVLVAVASVFLATAGAASRAAGSTYVIKATLDTKHEVPAAKDAKGAKGVLTGKLTVNGKKSSFVWQLSFSGLTGRATASHLHYAAAGKAGPIALPLCVPCAGSPAHGEYKGPYVATAAFLKAILHGGMYANVHTKVNPNGEIRGQVKATASK